MRIFVIENLENQKERKKKESKTIKGDVQKVKGKRNGTFQLIHSLNLNKNKI